MIFVIEIIGDRWSERTFKRRADRVGQTCVEIVVPRPRVDHGEARILATVRKLVGGEFAHRRRRRKGAAAVFVESFDAREVGGRRGRAIHHRAVKIAVRRVCAHGAIDDALDTDRRCGQIANLRSACASRAVARKHLRFCGEIVKTRDRSAHRVNRFAERKAVGRKRAEIGSPHVARKEKVA